MSDLGCYFCGKSHPANQCRSREDYRRHSLREAERENAELRARVAELEGALERALWLAEKWADGSGRSSPDHDIIADARAALAKEKT